MSQAEAEAAHAAQQPIAVGDIGGETMHTMARDAKNTSPDAASFLQGTTMDRGHTQNARVADVFSKLGWNKSAGQIEEKIQEVASAANKDAYDKFNKFTSGGIWNDDLARLISSPAGKAALDKTLQTSGNVSAARGGSPMKNPFVTLDDGTVTLANPNVKPTGEFWNHIQRNLRALSDKAATYGEQDKFNAGTISDIRKGINDIIDAHTTLPNGESLFKNARQGAAQFFGADDALEAGRLFFRDKSIDIRDVPKMLSKFSPQEKELFQQGYMAEAGRTAQGMSDNADITKRMFNNPTDRQKLRLALGGDRANEVERAMRIERIMTFFNNAVNGNSSTAKQLFMNGLAGGGLGASLGAGYSYANDGDMTKGAGVASAAGSALASLASHHVDSRLAAKVGKLLASQDINDIRKVYDLAGKSKALDKMFKDIELRISGATAGKTAEKSVDGLQDRARRIIDISR